MTSPGSRGLGSRTPVSVSRMLSLTLLPSGMETTTRLESGIGQARRLGRDIVLMAQGRIAEQGPARTFFETPQTAAARRYLAGALVV